MMGISLIPRRSGSLDRLDVARGIEGKCSRTRLVNGCLISQERVLSLGAGQAILRETIVLDEPPSLYTGLMGLSAMFVAFNLLDQDFYAEQMNERWASDTTFIWTRQGWLYLAVVMDLYSRRIVGWSMSRRNNRHLVLNALHMALGQREPGADLIHHSDRGAQYLSDDFQLLLQRNGITCSLSGKGSCYDNAVVESFFATLKRERVRRRKYRTRDEARADIFDYIERFYNRERRHGYVGNISPVEYEDRTLRT